jgi:predicted nucleic acid-binding protein
MRVLVDTCVWSAVLRRSATDDDPLRSEMEQLIRDGDVELMGPIRQELLSGVRVPEQFERLKGRLEAFPDLGIVADDYVTAARFYNQCRARGVQGSGTDLLICAVAVRLKMRILTVDRDFAQYASILPIELYRFG